MTELNNPQHPASAGPDEHTLDQPHEHAQGHGHNSHHLMMMLMCAPMLLVFVVLITAGGASFTTLLFPLACMAMMAAMMAFMMPRNR